MDKIIKRWIDKNINIDLRNKNVFITGSNSGIGFEEAKEYLYRGANLFLLSRNIDKLNIAKNELLSEFKDSNINIIKLDLADLNSIKECAYEVKKYDVDIFINNAGVFRLPNGTTNNGFEITMGTNFLGTLYLNDLLNEYFKSLKHDVINIITSSVSTRITKLDYNNFYYQKKYVPLIMYARSKCAINNMFYNYLDEYKDTNIKFKLIHPGACYTPLIKKGYRFKPFEFVASGFMKLFFHSPAKAALTALYALNHNIVGPRGLFEISGYPKETKFRVDKNYRQCIEFGRKEIKSILGDKYDRN